MKFYEVEVAEERSVRRRLEHHPLRIEEDQPQRVAQIRAAAVDFSLLILRSCPKGPDRDRAVGLVEEAAMWANNAIALEVGR